MPICAADGVRLSAIEPFGVVPIAASLPFLCRPSVRMRKQSLKAGTRDGSAPFGPALDKVLVAVTKQRAGLERGGKKR